MKFPNIASFLKSATTNINIASATAPSNWQVLTATSPTTATWQTISAWWSQTATTVANTPAWTISATTVQGAINELDTEKAKLAGDITQSFWASTIELWHASDTTISRSSSGVLAVEGVIIPSVSSTNTLTNKRITKRVLSATSYTTNTWTSLNCDNLDIFIVTAQSWALKLNNPTWTPTDGQMLMVAITWTGAIALTYDTQFEASSQALPPTTVATARLNMLFCWRADTSKWIILASV